MSKQYLTPDEVVERYDHHLTTRTLANWRSAGTDGPPYLKLGGRILYPIEDLIEWENRRTINNMREHDNDH